MESIIDQCMHVFTASSQDFKHALIIIQLFFVNTTFFIIIYFDNLFYVYMRRIIVPNLGNGFKRFTLL